MPLRCPVCKADNSTGPACRRCKADLSMLLALEDQRAALLSETRRAFDEENVAAALRLAQDAHTLRQGDDTRQWLALLQLLTENFGEAWSAYQNMSAHG